MGQKIAERFPRRRTDVYSWLLQDPVMAFELRHFWEYGTRQRETKSPAYYCREKRKEKKDFSKKKYYLVRFKSDGGLCRPDDKR